MTAEQIAGLVDQAERAPGGTFVEPARLARIKSWWRHDLQEWAEAVLYRDIPDVWRLPWWSLIVLDLAHDVEPCPPPPPKLTQRRAAQQAVDDERRRAEASRHEAVRAEWAALRAALPVPVEVAHNYTSHRHVEGYSQGVDHIILLTELHLGRLHRAARDPLCWIPSRRHELEVFDDPGDHRLPECQRCLRTAYRVTRRVPSRLLVRSA